MEEINKCSVNDVMEVKEDQPPKRVKTNETVNSEEGEDRISLLPDCLIIDEILCRLEFTKQSITTGTLSKRWQHLWPSVSILRFQNNKYQESTDFYLSVDKTLSQCRLRQLKSLSVHTVYDIQFESHVNNWIRFATSRKVQQLELDLSNIVSDNENKFVMKDESFFVNSNFTHIHLGGCIYNHPTGPISWNNLISLSISSGKLDENLIANILSGSPLLDTLKLENCCGFSRLDITSKSVKNLELSGYGWPYDDGILYRFEINAPYVLSLTIQGKLFLYKLSLLDVSSLVKANLNFNKFLIYWKEEEEEMLKSHILHFRHVKELEIGIRCHEVLSRLKDKGFIFPSNLIVLDD